MSNLNESLRPFTRFCRSIGYIPASYVEAMSYEQQIWWFCDLLRDTVIPAIDKNAEATKELQVLYDELKNYFENLDVQEEINNKLDSLVEDGTMERLINYTLLTKKLSYYLITSEMTETEIKQIFELEVAKVIEFQKGVYNFSEPIYLSSNTKILFNDSEINCSYRTQFDDNILFFNYKPDDNYTNYNGISNIEFYNAKFNSGFALMHGKNIKFVNCSFSEQVTGHALQIAACKNLIVDCCQFFGSKLVSYGDTETEKNQELIQLDYCIFGAQPYANSDSLMYDKTPNDTIIIKNCTFNESITEYGKFYAGIGSHTISDNFEIYNKNIQIYNNTFIRPIHSAIKLLYSQNSEIKNNYFSLLSETSYGIRINESNNNILIDNNQFTNGLCCIACLKTQNSSLIKNLTISNNRLEQTHDNNAQIILGDIDECNIINNTSNGFSNSFIFAHFYLTKIIIRNNTILNNYDKTCIFFSNSTDVAERKIEIADNLVELRNNGYFLGFNRLQENVYVHNNLINIPRRAINPQSKPNSFEFIYDIPIELFNGNALNVENQSLNESITNFNKLVISLGGGNERNNYTLYPATNINEKLQNNNNTYYGTVVDSNLNINPFKLMFKNDDTFNYNSTMLLRSIYGINTLS